MKTIKATKSVKTNKTNVQPLHHITVYRNKDNVITKFRIRVKVEGKNQETRIHFLLVYEN
ncbi:TPA: hypothetical protein ACO4GF_005089 [Escherichia coli]